MLNVCIFVGMTHKQQQKLADKMVSLGGYVNSYGITCLRANWVADGMNARMLQFEAATSDYPKFFAMDDTDEVSLKRFATLVDGTEDMMKDGLMVAVSA